MQKLEQMMAVEPIAGTGVDRDNYEAFLKSLRGRRFAYVRIQRGINVAKFERPGDDREMVRKPESCFPGEIIQIEMTEKCNHMQTPEEIAFLLANGTLAPSSRKAFDNAPNWEATRAEAAAEARARQEAENNAVMSLSERVASLEGLFKQMVATAKALNAKA